MMTSPEPHPGSSTDIKLTHALFPKIPMEKIQTFTRHEFEDETTEWIENRMDSGFEPQNTEWDSELLHQIRTQQQDSDNDDDCKISNSMIFRKLYDAVTEERAS